MTSRQSGLALDSPVEKAKVSDERFLDVGHFTHGRFCWEAVLQAALYGTVAAFHMIS